MERLSHGYNDKYEKMCTKNGFKQLVFGRRKLIIALGFFCLFVLVEFLFLSFCFFFLLWMENTCLIKMDMCIRNTWLEKSKIYIRNFRQDFDALIYNS